MPFDSNEINKSSKQIERIQPIYVDPQCSMSLKNKRKTFQMVPSVFEPPQEDILAKNQNQWKNTTDRNLSKSRKMAYQNQKYSNSLFHVEMQMLPNQKIKNLKFILESQNIAPNVQYIWKLLPSHYKKQIIHFQQGDCIPFNSKNEDKFVLLLGQVQVMGLNEHSFKRKQGYLFILSNQTKNKIKEIIVLRSTKILRISSQIYQTILKRYLFLKNCQRIKFIKYCPFFIWRNQLTQDLAHYIQMRSTQKQEVIYQANTNPDAIYFVKQGIVLLQRNVKVQNPVVINYQLHYEKNEITQKDTILVVRKGMAFGIDGILIKEFASRTFSKPTLQSPIIQHKESDSVQIHLKQLQNTPIDIQNHGKRITKKENKRKNQRIYTAKALGNCQLYVLDRRILETLFSLSEPNEQIHVEKVQISQQQLKKMSIQYSSMILSHSHSKTPQALLRKKELTLNLPAERAQSLAACRFQASLRSKQSPIRRSQSSFSKTNKINFKQNLTQRTISKNSLYNEDKIQPNQFKIKAQKPNILVGVQKLESIKYETRQRNNQKVQALPKILNSDRSVKDILRVGAKRQNPKIQDVTYVQMRKKLDFLKNKSQFTSILYGQCKGRDSLQSISKKIRDINEVYQKRKENPSFINIKSYKSIISTYQNKY